MFIIHTFSHFKKVKSMEIGYYNLAYSHCLKGRAGLNGGRK